ncbi:DUF4954 family protein [Gynurincola endophyticus]|uniref:DUF4954 family protein n=1 Tax=Gynurincola endophyticus TaxID=2479004 RepID=UPI000F8E1188|nr:DUF4954 family protein [Gynurincola endophyticus]
MNIIQKQPIHHLGYNFIEHPYLPEGKDEYYIRYEQNNNGIKYRQLTAFEIEILVRNRNTTDNWNNIFVSDAFNPELVQNCKFYGLVRIGKLESFYLEFHNLKRPVGLYNSTIISCDFGDNVVVDNVNFLSHVIVGSEVILINTNEIATTNKSKFGNGIIKEGEKEDIRIWLEVCNENGGRKILPFIGMLPGDAFLWSRYRGNTTLMEQFKNFTQQKFDNKRGYYGTIGDRTVIKNCKIIKDTNIGTDAYIKGANKIKNVTIHSNATSQTQVGEGCELVNGIVDYGCRVFYGVKAVRFFMASHSQLKYGARLINSYLGDNSTISCCEVLNSLIFPSHEQHHNNSFLCASLIQGQSNIAAGATLGSNHNSRSADGELIAGRGFWPALCVSIKHNSVFASYTILAKGDYSSELNIPLPFSLVSNDAKNNELTVMPGYWFQYNMYALARNSWKYIDRDKRVNKQQLLEFNYLAPDTVNEMLNAIEMIEHWVGDAYFQSKNNFKEHTDKAIRKQGKELLLNDDPIIDTLDIKVTGFENTKRKTRIVKLAKGYQLYRKMVEFYTAKEIISFIEQYGYKQFATLVKHLPASAPLSEWVNVGGQLIPGKHLDTLLHSIETGKVNSWNQVHAFYEAEARDYSTLKLQQALHVYKLISGISLSEGKKEDWKNLLQNAILTKEWIYQMIYQSREKDYTSPFRQMVYTDPATMDAVIGKFEENTFILQEEVEFKKFKKEVQQILKKFNL